MRPDNFWAFIPVGGNGFFITSHMERLFSFCLNRLHLKYGQKVQIQNIRSYISILIYMRTIK